MFSSDIEHFFWAFREYLKFIDEKCKGRFEGTILICVYLDSLSGYKYGRIGVKNRFINFILNFSGLEKIYSLVSIPLLIDRIKIIFSDRIDVIDEIKDILQLPNVDEILKWEYPNIDLNVVDLSSKLRGNIPSDIYNIAMKQAYAHRYVNILYDRYRCQPIHEARLSEQEAPNFGKNTKPYYTIITIAESPRQLLPKVVWFAIPFIFLRKTLENCVNNFEKECIKYNINPFSALD